MQTLNLESNLDESTRKGEIHVESTTSLRARLARFLSDRRAYRERPDYLPELIIMGIVIIAAAWPILSLVAAMELVR